MSGYALTPLAKADIFDIWSYIAEDNQDAADSVEQAIYDACAFLAAGPLRGHRRPDLTTRPVRFWTLSRYPNYSVVTGPKPFRFKLSPCCMGKEISSTFLSSGLKGRFPEAKSPTFTDTLDKMKHFVEAV
jgi:antitoxin ParD1/3/4